MALATVVGIFLGVILTSTFNLTDAFSMKMIPIDHPHLQVLPQNITFQERHQFLANLSLSRAHRARNAGSNSNFSVETFRGYSYQTQGNYFVTELFFGEPDSLDNRYVLLDTGDDKTWIQCDGCDPCFELKSGNLHAQDLPNYARLSTDDARCNPQFVFDGSCGYQSSYGPASTEGYMGTVSFAFAKAPPSKPEMFPNLAFGCGIKNENINFGINTGSDNLIAGIHGLAPSSRSFMYQLPGATKGRFTYCLTSYTEPDQGISTIYFGDDAQMSGDGVQQLKMKEAQRYTAYVAGISVDGNRLPIDPSIFIFDPTQTQVRGKTGFLFDTGAPHTVLAMSAYQPLRDAVAKYFQDHYGWQPSEEALYDLCYEQSLPTDLTTPQVVFHFYKDDKQTEEVDMVLPRENVFITFNDGICMSIQPIPDPGPCIFGAHQQANFKFMFDLANWYWYFVPQRCQENL